MMLTNQQLLLLLALCLALRVISNDAGPLSGLEIKQLNFCHSHDETAKITINPWPFIAFGERFNVSLTFTPAVDVFAASIELKATSESDGHIIGRLQDNPCRPYSDFCSLPLPAGETRVWTCSRTLNMVVPPGLKMTAKVVAQLYNEDHIMFLCVEIVATIH